jgi:SAM-dependent methyltransferase
VKRCLACESRFDGDRWTCPACGTTPPIEDGVPLLAPELAVEGEGYESWFFDAMMDIEERNWWFRSRNRLILSTLRAAFPAARSALEIGCGTGFVLRARARDGLEVTGTELFPRGIEHARRRVPEAEFVQLDARRLPYRDAFDVVGAFDVLEHIADDRDVLAEMAAAARPGGGILVTVPQHPWMWSKADDLAHHERRYTRRELVGKVEAAGLEVVRVTSFVSLALPAMAVSRWLERRSDKPYEPLAEFQLGAAANRALDGVARAEQALIGRGASLPAGGSLLLAARRG